MSDQMSLGGILDDKPAVEAPVETQVETPEPEAPAVEKTQSLRKAHQDKEQTARAEGDGRVRDPETGQFVAKPEPAKVEVKPEVKPGVKEPAHEMTPQYKAAIAQANDERKKRQELERRLAALEGVKPKEPAKSFWDDPEGALQTFEQKIEGVALNTRLNTAEAICRSKHTDFDEKIAVFAEIINQVPGLHQQWLSTPDPAEFAYQTGKSHLDLRQAGGIPELRAQIEKETRVKVEAELKDKYEKAAAQRAALPGSLSDARSTGVNRPVWGGPTSLDGILGSK